MVLSKDGSIRQFCNRLLSRKWRTKKGLLAGSLFFVFTRALSFLDISARPGYRIFEKILVFFCRLCYHFGMEVELQFRFQILTQGEAVR